MRGRAGLVLVAALAAMLAVVPAAGAQKAHSSIVGGSRIAVTSVPWQVYVAVGSNLACGGSVLDARHVLTAAHCVVPEGQGTPRPASDFTVWAGYDNVHRRDGARRQPEGRRDRACASIRYYEERSKADDVAVLTLGAALAVRAADPADRARAGRRRPGARRRARLQRLRHAAGGRAAERAPVRRGARRDLRRPVPRRGGPELDRERPVRRARPERARASPTAAAR